MKMADENIKQELVNPKNMDEAVQHLAKTNQDSIDYIADCVAALCDVSKKVMLSNTQVLHNVRARYLYWYACRYMTNESYEKISMMSQQNDGYKHTASAISSGIKKMSSMIEDEPLWNKRWLAIKSVIKEQFHIETNKEVILVKIPKALKGKVNIITKYE
jgi:chromosomal replication initiation ATPase DnaA